MIYECSKCKRFGMEWDGRTKILICCYKDCNYVVRIPNQITVPDENIVLNAIEKDKFSRVIMENDVEQIPESIKNKCKSFLKMQAHCGECGFCFYDSFFRSHRCCIDAHKIIEPRTFACKHFYYMQADMRPNWENEFIFGAERTW